MFIVFYTVKVVYICNLFISYCLCDTLMDRWNICIYVCMHACMHACRAVTAVNTIRKSCLDSTWGALFLFFVSHFTNDRWRILLSVVTIGCVYFNTPGCTSCHHQSYHLCCCGHTYSFGLIVKPNWTPSGRGELIVILYIPARQF